MSISNKMTVESYDVQPNGNIKISSLLKYFQKAAGDDVNRTSLGYFTLADMNIAFVLTKINLKIYKDIKIYDDPVIISHPRKTRGASFPRDFIVKVNDEVVAVACSMWVLIDLEKRCILRPSVIDNVGSLDISDDDLYDVDDIRRNVDVNSLPRTDVLRVSYSHLDMNCHLNNTFYSDFIFNYIGDRDRKSDAGMYMQINYKAEALLGDSLSLHYSDCNDASEYDIVANIGDKTCFTAFVSFSKNN